MSEDSDDEFEDESFLILLLKKNKKKFRNKKCLNKKRDLSRSRLSGCLWSRGRFWIRFRSRLRSFRRFLRRWSRILSWFWDRSRLKWLFLWRRSRLCDRFRRCSRMFSRLCGRLLSCCRDKMFDWLCGRFWGRSRIFR